MTWRFDDTNSQFELTPSLEDGNIGLWNNVWTYPATDYPVPDWMLPYNDSDLLCNPAINYNIFDWLDGFVNASMPYMKFTFTGSGIITLYLLSMFQGGAALVVIDDDWSTVDWVNLQSGNVGNLMDNALSLIDSWISGDMNPEVIREYKILEDGEHSIYVYFVPYIEGDLSLQTLTSLGWGGGFRKIELCGRVHCYNLDKTQITIVYCSIATMIAQNGQRRSIIACVPLLPAVVILLV